MPGAERADTSEDMLYGLTDDAVVDDLITDCDGDPRAAVAALLRIVQALVVRNNELAEAVSPGFMRLGPAGGPGRRQ